MTERPTIAFDCDEVFTGTAQGILDIYYQRYGVHVPLEKFYTPGSDKWGCDDPAEAARRFNEILHSPELTDEASVIEGAPEVIGRLATKYSLVLVTGRPDELIPATKRFIDRHFPGMFTALECTNHFVDAKRRPKGLVCTQYGAHILVDDHTGHIENALEAGVPYGIVFGDYPWNRDYQTGPRTERCRDWSTLEAIIDRLASQ